MRTRSPKLSHTQVIDIALKHAGDAEAAAQAIVKAAYEKGSEDNLTAVVVMFTWQLEKLDELLERWGGMRACLPRSPSLCVCVCV